MLGAPTGSSHGRSITELGERESALRHAEQAMAEASAPRQPLALLASHRLLGMLATEAGRFVAATGHLETSLELANACAAPYERALTLLALAELSAATGDGAAARRMLAKARDLHPSGCPVGTRPRHAPRRAPHPQRRCNRDLSRRTLAARGGGAAILSLSVRTIERHVENLYRKINVHGRADATAYAFRHHLT